MAKVDRLGWTAGLAFTSYGLHVGVRVNNHDLLDRLVEYFPPGWKPSKRSRVERLYSLLVGSEARAPGVRRFNLLYANVGRIARSLSIDEVFEVFESNLGLYVAEMAKRRIFVHAGAVGWKGKAILIPGRSFSGKTTLVAEFVRAGASYYSDEYAVLDSMGRVYPFTRALAMREFGDTRQKKCPVESLGGRRGIKPLSVGMVLFSEYKSGARWRPRQLSPGQAALALLDNTVSIRRRPEAALDAVEQIVSKAAALKFTRGEAQEAVSTLLRMLPK